MNTQGITITVNAESEAAAAKMAEFFNSAIEGMDHMSKASEFLEELAGKFIAVFSIGAVVEFTREAINAAEAIGMLSRQVGVSVQTLSALKEIANANKIPFDELRVGLTHFNSVLNDARENGGQAMQSFRNLSEEIAIAAAQGRPAEEVYRMISERFRQMPDGIQKAAAAQALFGRNSAEWVTLLNEGAEEMDRIKGLNGGITPEAVGQASAFNRSLRELHEELEKVFRSLAVDILPTLQQLVTEIKILTEATDAAGNSTSALADIFKFIVSAVIVVGNAFNDIGKVIGYSAEGWVLIFQSALEIIQMIAAQIKAIYTDLVHLVADMVDTLFAAQEASLLAATGHFREARDLMAGQIKGMKDDASDLAEHLKLAFGGIPAVIQNLVSNGWALNEGLLKDIVASWTAAADFINNLWNKPAAQAKAAAPGGGAIPGTGGSATTPGDLDKINASRLGLQREMVQLQQKQIETDPALVQIDRNRLLLPLMLQEREVIETQIAQQQVIADRESSITMEKITAQKEILKLKSEEVELDAKIYKASSFGDYIQNTYLGLKKLSSAWADLGTNAVAYTLSTIQNGLNAASQSLAGAIQGTKNWGQAWAQAMTQAVNGIVQMAAQYVAAKLAMMAVDSVFTAKNKTDAATTTATSGIAGIGKAGEQGGWVGILIYMGVFLAAMAAMEGIAAGVSVRATGGPVSAGMPYMVGERGPELIWPKADAHVYTASQTASIMSFSRGSGGAAGGQGAPVNVMIHFQDDPQRTEKDIRDNPRIHHMVVSIAKRNAHIIHPHA